MADCDISPKVRLESRDGRFFSVDRAVAEASVTIKNMLEDIGQNDDAVPLPNIAGSILEKVIAYCEYHRTHPPAESVSNVKDGHPGGDIEPWDAEFCKVDQAVLFELILAANYLDIKPLLDVTCRTVANMIRGKTPEEIRKAFGIKNDFTPDEEEAIRKENEWCEPR